MSGGNVPGGGNIYSATYSNVPVYEFNIGPGVQIMRRRADDWINATHILKAAGHDKPARTRILEREVQKGVHEKVQGGYGKYQGTWIPLPDGLALAERSDIINLLRPIFDFVPGDFSPPVAPKHATAASSKPRAPRQSMAKKLAAAKAAEEQQAAAAAHQAQLQQQQYEMSIAPQDMDYQATESQSVMSESIMDEDMYGTSQYSTSRKRKRDEPEHNMVDFEHQNWADALLDYFMLADSDDRFPNPPPPPPGVNIDKPIDDRDHTALHWAAAMGDTEVIRSLVDMGAKVGKESKNLETPLMRAVMFTNNYDKQTMPKLMRTFFNTVRNTDYFGSTVFHHIAATTSSKSKYVPARYYLDTIINALKEQWIPDEISKLLDMRDQNGDTAVHIAARNGARKCVRIFMANNVSLDLRNNHGETADEMIRQLNARRRTHPGARGRDASSSPFGPDRAPLNGDSSVGALSMPVQPEYRSETANMLLNRIGPTFMAKVRSLALAYEAEFQEKETEAIENENVIKKRRTDVDALNKQAAEQKIQLETLRMQLAASGETHEQEKLREEDELRALEAEAMSLLEYEQRESLGRAMHKAGIAPGSNTKPASARAGHHHIQKPMGPPPPANGMGDIEQRKALAAKVRMAQIERQKLTRDIVRNMSTAGLAGRHHEYKRLIHGALGIKEDELESMLDEIIGQLEEDRRERMVMAEAV
ncbi:apses-domain-containing protein [Microthyrium microscopicum]|uniref:Apses-domain-containing protein n=1 Tax=Microthyrium microscopicum TaxID=703497 RepID=A0A6A6UHI9_9PEZI|nr:apses-domain-containing protein [Microthyrium microscopicum]